MGETTHMTKINQKSKENYERHEKLMGQGERWIYRCNGINFFKFIKLRMVTTLCSLCLNLYL